MDMADIQPAALRAPKSDEIVGAAKLAVANIAEIVLGNALQRVVDAIGTGGDRGGDVLSVILRNHAERVMHMRRMLPEMAREGLGIGRETAHFGDRIVDRQD